MAWKTTHRERIFSSDKNVHLQEKNTMKTSCRSIPRKVGKESKISGSEYFKNLLFDFSVQLYLRTALWLLSVWKKNMGKKEEYIDNFSQKFHTLNKNVVS